MQDPTPEIQKGLLSLKDELCPHEICTVHRVTLCYDFLRRVRFP